MREARNATGSFRPVMCLLFLLSYTSMGAATYCSDIFATGVSATACTGGECPTERTTVTENAAIASKDLTTLFTAAHSAGDLGMSRGV